MEYRVLARKYRPAVFADLIGQEVLVRTLSNAIASGRIAHAFLLTGIRGVGKTTTARIIARALNCVGEDGSGGPTITPCGVCANCRMIAEDRHVDVVEMDAASRTGVGDIRDIIETVHYAPASGRYKIYIIDEVHMLSTNAFNALLKTLEEPPPHVKFIFATTEARKIPVTILSRCQRFDLKRVSEEVLGAHLEAIARKEGTEISPQAKALLAQAAEGSVRDGLSLLDQAMAHHAQAGKPVGEEEVRGMLGLADRSRTLDLLEAVLAGDAPKALTQFAQLYEAGADPLLLLQDMLEFAHFIMRIKVSPKLVSDITYTEQERMRASALAEQLSVPVLSRLWQMLLKGAGEVRLAPSPASAAEMVLVRMAYASDLPTPAEAIRALSHGEPVIQSSAQPQKVASPAVVRSAVQSAATPAVVQSSAPMPQDFPTVVALLEREREALLSSQLKQFASLITYAPGRIELCMKQPMPRDFASRVAQALERLTGTSWKVALSEREGEPTLHAQEEVSRAQKISEAASHPLVGSVFEHFPGAEVVDVTEGELA